MKLIWFHRMWSDLFSEGSTGIGNVIILILALSCYLTFWIYHSFQKGTEKIKSQIRGCILSVWNWPSFIVIEDSPLLLALGLIFTFNEQVHYLLFLRLFWIRSNRWWGFVRKKLNLAPLENSSHQFVGGRNHNITFSWGRMSLGQTLENKGQDFC